MYDIKQAPHQEPRADGSNTTSSDSDSSPVRPRTRANDAGSERVDLLLSLRDGDEWFITASQEPDSDDLPWAANIRARPQVEIEAQINGAIRSVEVSATELAGGEYENVLSRFMKRPSATVPLPGIAQRSTDHRQAVFRLTRHQPQTPLADDTAAAPVGPDDLSRTVSIRQPITDENLPHYGVVCDNYTMLLGKHDTAGRYALIDMHVLSGGGPPPHRHDFEEMFYVLEGQIDVTFRGETTTINPRGSRQHSRALASQLPQLHRLPRTNVVHDHPTGARRLLQSVGKPLPTRTTPPDQTESEAEQSLARAIELGPPLCDREPPSRLRHPACNRTGGADSTLTDGLLITTGKHSSQTRSSIGESRKGGQT